MRPLKSYLPKPPKEKGYFGKLSQPIEEEILDNVIEKICSEIKVDKHEVEEGYCSKIITFYKNGIIIIKAEVSYMYNEIGSIHLGLVIKGYSVSIL